MSTVQPSRVLSTVGTPQKKMFHGIYEASVVNNNDPLGSGRVQLYVPQVLGLAVSNWAVPLGFSTQDNVPAVNTIVHAYFTGGDVNHPVYAFTTNISAAIQPAPWTAMTPLNGWSNVSGYIAASYRLLNNGSEVEVIGNLANSSGAGDQPVIAQLPADCYPLNNHIFSMVVVAGVLSYQVTGSTDIGFVSDTSVSQGILPLSEEYLVPTSDHTISSTPFTLGPSGTQWQSWDQNSEIVDLVTGGQQYLVSGEITSQNAYTDINYDSPQLILTTGGTLEMSNFFSAMTQISFHETIPLTL
jgi:hypothetical protein